MKKKIVLSKISFFMSLGPIFMIRGYYTVLLQWEGVHIIIWLASSDVCRQSLLKLDFLISFRPLNGYLTVD